MQAVPKPGKQLLPLVLLITVLVLSTLACNIGVPIQPEPEISDPLPVFTLSPDETPQEAVTPQPNGSASGRVCYPSEFIPPMQAFFYNAITGLVTEINIAENQQQYSVELAPGEYYAYAWRAEYLLGGGYTETLVCPEGQECPYALKSFQVVSNAETSGIDLCDWIFQPESLPAGFREALQGRIDYGEPGAGLIFSTLTGMYQISDQLIPVKIAELGDAELSPDGNSLLYSQDGDIYLLDLASGNRLNLTQTPDTEEIYFNWVQSIPGKVIFSAIPLNSPTGPGFNGYPGLVNSDGSEYQVFDPLNNTGIPAVSPNGTTIAYGAGTSLWLYDLEDGLSAFNHSQYGLDPTRTFLGSPSWSPDGTKMAFQGTTNEVASGFGIVVIDLVANTSRWVFEYELPGMDGFPPAPVWSTDGQLIAVEAYDFDPAKRGIWVIPVEGDASQAVHVSAGGSFPTWSPDNRWLAFSVSSEAETAVYLAERNVWSPQKLDLPELSGAGYINIRDWR